MAEIYVTRDGDMLDSVASKFYGGLSGRVVEQVLEANPHLADWGPLLPAGLEIRLPSIDNSTQVQAVRLWD